MSPLLFSSISVALADFIPLLSLRHPENVSNQRHFVRASGSRLALARVDWETEISTSFLDLAGDEQRVQELAL